MSALAKIKLNSAGVEELLKSDGILDDVTERAHRIAAAAGPGHVVNAGVGPNRARAEVVTETTEARRAEAVDRRLTNAIDAGR